MKNTFRGIGLRALVLLVVILIIGWWALKVALKMALTAFHLGLWFALAIAVALAYAWFRFRKFRR